MAEPMIRKEAGQVSEATDRYEVVERRLKDAQGAEITLADWINEQRQGNQPVSWQSISFELWQATNLRVNPETLRRWHLRNIEDQEGEEAAS